MAYVTFDENGDVNAVLGTPTEETTEVADDDSRYVAWLAARQAEQYIGKRLKAYPSRGDQFDMLWHAIDSGDWTSAKMKTTDFYTELKAVKDANPKP